METQKIINILTSITNVPQEELKDDTKILESNIITSLGLLELISKLEKEFSIVILPEELIRENFADIATIRGFVESKI